MALRHLLGCWAWWHGSVVLSNSNHHALAPWHFLYFLPLPQGQGSLRPTFSPSRRTVSTFGGGSSGEAACERRRRAGCARRWRRSRSATAGGSPRSSAAAPSIATRAAVPAAVLC